MTPDCRSASIPLLWIALALMLSSVSIRAQHTGSWQGFGGLGSGCMGDINAMVRASNGDLYVGGRLTACGGVPIRGVARWDGTEWTAVTPELTREVTALALGPDDELYVAELLQANTGTGGPWTAVVRRWEGLQWRHVLQRGVASGGNAGIRSMLVDRQGQLHVGLDIGASALAEGLNGELISFRSGRVHSSALSEPLPGVFDQPVHRIRVASNGDLLVGGSFTQIDGQPFSRVARWNGTAWQALGAGVNGWVRDLELVGADVVVVGNFTTAGAIEAQGIARWNGSWSAFPGGLGKGEPLLMTTRVLAADGDGFFVGGVFNANPDNPVSRVARWSGAEWQALDGNLGLGLDTTSTTGLVHDGSLLLAGGLRGGRTPLNRLGRWTGQGWEAFGGGPGGFVNAFMRLPSGDLLAATTDYTVQGTSLVYRSQVKQWNGSVWSNLGPDFPGRAVAISPGPDGALYVAGDRMPIHRWDGTNWVAITESLTVNAMTLDGDQLLVGGSMSAINGVPVRALATWDGSVWRDIGSPEMFSVSSIVVHAGIRDVATMGGVFRRADDVWTRLGSSTEWAVALAYSGSNLLRATSLLNNRTQVSRWTGSDWEPASETINGSTRTLVPDGDGGMYLLGAFASVGPRLSTNLARWRPSAELTVAASLPVCNDAALFAVAPSPLAWASPGAERCTASESGTEKTTWAILDTLSIDPGIPPPQRVPAALAQRLHTRGGSVGSTTLSLACTSGTGASLPAITRTVTLTPTTCTAPTVQVPSTLTSERVLEDGTVRYAAALANPDQRPLHAQMLRQGTKGLARAQVLDGRLVVHYRPDRSPREGEVMQDTLEVLVGDDRVARRQVYTITVPVVTMRLGGPVRGLPADALVLLRAEPDDQRLLLLGDTRWELGRRLTPGEAFRVRVEFDSLDHVCAALDQRSVPGTQPSLTGIASLRDQLDHSIVCGRSSHQMLVTSPVVAPGGTGRLKLVLSGGTPADFYHSTVCFQSERLTLGTPQVPPTADGLVCEVGAAGTFCPTGFDRQLRCERVGGVPTLMGFPQVIEVPLVAGTTLGEARVTFGVRNLLTPYWGTGFIEGQVWVGTGQTIGGSVQGLGPGQSLRLRNHATDEVRVVSANGSYTLSERQGPGSIHRVRVEASPAGLDCRLANGEGVVGDSAVTTLDVQCVDVQLHRDGFEG